MPIGKYKGKDMSDIPEYYLEWVLKNMKREEVLEETEKELQRRGVKI